MTASNKTTSSRLRHKLSLQQDSHTPDGAGGYQKSWSTLMDLWAEIIPITTSGAGNRRSSGKEILMAGQVQSEISHKILLRYQDGITPAMRLLYESRVFNIRYVANSGERRNTLELLVQEGVAT